jgi:hypothetical protein
MSHVCREYGPGWWFSTTRKVHSMALSGFSPRFASETPFHACYRPVASVVRVIGGCHLAARRARLGTLVNKALCHWTQHKDGRCSHRNARSLPVSGRDKRVHIRALQVHMQLQWNKSLVLVSN